MPNKKKEIPDYDKLDTSKMIDPKSPLKFSDIGIELPTMAPTQVVSIRVPTTLLNEIKALGSEYDVPYQALIKLFLSDGVKRRRRKQA
ncbi:MAG: hypothetical protein HYW48_09095 [Deltaproteobacteria bacterium]|nr:hypothetical protein [Deltaproteobacteria bacterium]